MKKTLAFISAAAAVLALCTSCGRNDDKASDMTAEPTAVVSENDGDDSKKEDGAKDDETADDAEGSSEEQQYADLVKALLDAGNKGDMDRLMHITLPDKICAPMKATAIFDPDFQELMDDFSDIQPRSVKIIDCIEASPAEKEIAEKMYSILDVFFGVLADKGITADMLENGTMSQELSDETEDTFKLFTKIYDLRKADVDITVRLDFFRYVTFEVDGKDTTMPVYKVSGEDKLHMDCAFCEMFMSGRAVDDAEQARSDASTVLKASGAAMVELEEEEDFSFDTAVIISSKSEWNTCDEKDAAKVIDYMKYYIDFNDFGDFFIVAKGGLPLFSAAECGGTTGISNNYVNLEDTWEPTFWDELGITDDMTLEEIYDIVKESTGL